jgi:lipid-A-disaccharide synthase
MSTDLFVLAAEPSADLQGEKLITELLRQRPSLSIAAVAGPRMRPLPIKTLFPMENLMVMGFLDVLCSLPKIAKQFFTIRNAILSLNPKAVVTIDYPGFNLRLARSLRNKGYRGKLIHYVCPTVWAWGKKRIPLMAEHFDHLLTLFPFEPAHFQGTSLKAEYVGHPLTAAIPPTSPTGTLLGLFPGSRETEIERNFPLQVQVAKRLLSFDSSLTIAVSIARTSLEPRILQIASDLPCTFYPPDQAYSLMRNCRAALATSGTVTLELALHSVPTAVNFAIRPLDLFIAQKIFSIDLPHYCIVNIIASKRIFPELFGPNLTESALYHAAQKILYDEPARSSILEGLEGVRSALGEGSASLEAARSIISLAF